MRRRDLFLSAIGLALAPAPTPWWAFLQQQLRGFTFHGQHDHSVLARPMSRQEIWFAGRAYFQGIAQRHSLHAELEAKGVH